MAKVESVEIKVRFKMPLWDCVKLRISGLFKNIESINTVGEVQTIQFKKGN